jgi:hypothetical protein
MSRPSTSELSHLLIKFAAATKPFTARDVKKHQVPMCKGFGLSDETFGRDSRIYIHCPTHADRHRIEASLQGEGVTTVHTEYWPASRIVCVGVTYFKGWNWNE